MSSKAIKEHLPWPLLSVNLIVSLLIIIGGFIFCNYQKNKIVNEKQNELAAIATLKIEDIEKWRMEHIRDGEIIKSIIPRNQFIFDFLKNKNPSEFGKELSERFGIFISNYDYNSILLIDASGSIRLIYPPPDKLPTLNDSQLHDLQDSVIRFSDLHFSDDLPGKIHIDLQVPLFTTKENKRFATLLLRIDPEKVLYPLIQSWPTPSKSSETLLIRYENDSVLYLNELRHRRNTALKLKLPMNTNLPAAKAVKGYKGVFEGMDYRGIPVISYLSKIPGSPWFMVSKVDKKELYYPVLMSIVAISIIAFMAIFTITVLTIYSWKNQRLAYLKDLNSTKDKFFSIVSHDLRSPFSGINGLANLMIENLQRENLSTVKEYAKLILASTQNSMHLLKNLTEWSRLNTNRLAFTPTETDIVIIINEVTELLKSFAIQKSITLIKTTPSQLVIYADKDMMSSVFQNLISNSIKFSHPEGKIHITASEKENIVVVEITDFGIGMKKEVIEKLFRIGENVSTPGTQKEPGTGLGLILVKEFITLHEGNIQVSSEVGKSSSFIVTLPLR